MEIAVGTCLPPRAVSSDLAKLLKQGKERVKCVISSHHSLFFNVMCNELKKSTHTRYFMHKGGGGFSHSLRATDDTPFFHHVALLSELKQAKESGRLYTYHFNILRSILEKTAARQVARPKAPEEGRDR